MNILNKPNSPSEIQTSVLSATDDLTTENLFADKKEILIWHKGESYRLRITRQEKLILTK